MASFLCGGTSDFQFVVLVEHKTQH